MKLIIIGGVAGGTSAGAKARREDEDCHITLYEKDTDISYAACGIPYYIGDITENVDDLVPRNAEDFKEKYNIDVFTSHEVTAIHPETKKVTVTNLETGISFDDSYDKLIIATGAYAFSPFIEGMYLPHVFNVRTINDAKSIKRFIETQSPKSAAVIGTGFIGFEMLENLEKQGLKVYFVDNDDKLTPHLDMKMANRLKTLMEGKAVNLVMNAKTAKITEHQVFFEDGTSIDVDMVILSIGIRPETKLAQAAGVELGETKAIKVNLQMETNIKDIYACGDCIETFSSITGQAAYVPLGTTANKTGRIAGEAVTGGTTTYRGNLKTSIFKIYEYSVAMTGLSKKEAESLGYDVEIIEHTTRNKPRYMGGEKMYIYAVVDKVNRHLLGVQIIGSEGVDKHIDLYVLLITYKIPLEDYFHLDLSYAPPYSNVKDAIHYTGMIYEGKSDDK